MERTPEQKKRKARNAHRREWYRAIQELTPEQRHEREQRLLWHKLHSVFTRKEFVSYENLPKKLRDQVDPFPDFVFPL